MYIFNLLICKKFFVENGCLIKEYNKMHVYLLFSCHVLHENNTLHKQENLSKQEVVATYVWLVSVFYFNRTDPAAHFSNIFVSFDYGTYNTFMSHNTFQN